MTPPSKKAETRSSRVLPLVGKRSLVGWLALATTVVLWGSAFVAIRSALRSYSPEHLSLLRVAIAAAALVVVALFGSIRKPEPADALRIVSMGLVGVSAYQVLLNSGEVVVTAATASFLVATAPALSAILARLFLSERLHPIGWVGVAIAFSGTALLALSRGQALDFTQGSLLVLGAALSQAIFFLLQKPLLTRYSPAELTVYAMWIGLAPLLAFAGGVPQAVAGAIVTANLSVLWLGLAASAIAFITWGRALRDISLATAATALYLCPVVAVVLGWILLDERPRPTTILGGSVIVIGVSLVSRWGSGASASRRPSGVNAANPSR